MPNKRLKAGVAEIEITPSGKVELAAEFQPRQAEGIGAPLYAKALVLSNEAETLGIITLDLLGLNPASAAELEMLISQRTGIMPEALMIICRRLLARLLEQVAHPRRAVHNTGDRRNKHGSGIPQNAP